MVQDSKKYYENTENALPHKIVRDFIEMNVQPSKAVELGCGAGRDTVFLIKNGWNVLAIDREDTRKYISKKLDDEEKTRFSFKSQKFENIKLEENNLLVANFSIPFCDKDCFYEFWNKIVDSIQENGYFVGNFFGLNDSWVKIKNKMVFLSKEQVLELFKDSFEIVCFNEIEEDAKTGMGIMKHWHIYEVIARKNN